VGAARSRRRPHPGAARQDRRPGSARGAGARRRPVHLAGQPRRAGERRGPPRLGHGTPAPHPGPDRAGRERQGAARHPGRRSSTMTNAPTSARQRIADAEVPGWTGGVMLGLRWVTLLVEVSAMLLLGTLAGGVLLGLGPALRAGSV